MGGVRVERMQYQKMGGEETSSSISSKSFRSSEHEGHWLSKLVFTFLNGSVLRFLSHFPARYRIRSTWLINFNCASHPTGYIYKHQNYTDNYDAYALNFHVHFAK